jgi:hypothetical protein
MVIGENSSLVDQTTANELNNTSLVGESERTSALNQLTETSTDIIKVLDNTTNSNEHVEIKPEQDSSFSHLQLPENNNSDVLIASPDILQVPSIPKNEIINKSLSPRQRAAKSPPKE